METGNKAAILSHYVSDSLAERLGRASGHWASLGVQSFHDFMKNTRSLHIPDFLPVHRNLTFNPNSSSMSLYLPQGLLSG